MPDEWPLDVVSTFFQRGLRRELHKQSTSQILKSIAAGQNLQMSERYLDKVRKIPPKFQRESSEGPSPGMSAPDEGSIAEKEDGPVGSEKDPIGGQGEGILGEKEVLSSGGMEEKELGGSNGFFSPDIVNKELRNIHEAERGQDEELR